MHVALACAVHQGTRWSTRAKVWQRCCDWPACSSHLLSVGTYGIEHPGLEMMAVLSDLGKVYHDGAPFKRSSGHRMEHPGRDMTAAPSDLQ
eukprot:scaffold49740_cov24-Tisochrysis_lutea.AAC.1